MLKQHIHLEIPNEQFHQIPIHARIDFNPFLYPFFTFNYTRYVSYMRLYLQHFTNFMSQPQARNKPSQERNSTSCTVNPHCRIPKYPKPNFKAFITNFLYLRSWQNPRSLVWFCRSRREEQLQLLARRDLMARSSQIGGRK